MSVRTLFLTGTALGFIALGVGCSGSTTSSHPVTSTAPPFATTVADLVKNHTSDSEQPASLDSLNLSGSDVEDIHEFDALLGIQ